MAGSAARERIPAVRCDVAAMRNDRRASVGGPGYPSLTTAILALDRIDFAAGLRRLHHHRKSGAIACRTFMLGRFHGWLSHLNLSGARPSWALWVHHDVAGRTMEVGAILGCNNLKAI